MKYNALSAIYSFARFDGLCLKIFNPLEVQKVEEFFSTIYNEYLNIMSYVDPRNSFCQMAIMPVLV